MANPIGFEKTIKPYFTPCYRAHMIKMGPRIDLWDYDTVRDAGTWQQIHDAVEAQFMPMEGCPEGVWDDHTRSQFLKDFVAWKDGGFQP
ncbi:MAG TPA: hypothetical protein VF544_15665 [Pyrinomonadaceae bacterium]|jgi:hypothetical protein